MDVSRAPVAVAAPGGEPGAGAAGTLVFVVGPSGAGKDTLLAYARQRLAGAARSGRPVVFARRLITRAVDATEDHIEIAAAAFDVEAAAGRFALHWRANGLGYALGEDCRAGLAAGHLVVANGSRAAGRWSRPTSTGRPRCWPTGWPHAGAKPARSWRHGWRAIPRWRPRPTSR